MKQKELELIKECQQLREGISHYEEKTKEALKEAVRLQNLVNIYEVQLIKAQSQLLELRG